MIKNTRGFTAIEMAIIVLVIGFMLFGTIGTASPILKKGRITATRANMQNIMDVLSVYVQTNNRLPCPANPNQAIVAQPFGSEIGSGANGDALGSCSGVVSPEGIVPFKTLGISEDEIKDGWKNYITYRVSPVFTLDPDDDTRNVHKRCRIINKWVFDGDNRKPAKARFCCPGNAPAPGTDITIGDGVSEIWTYDRDANAGDYDTSEVPFTGNTAFDTVADNVTAPAVILTSHGVNGVGAFIIDGTRIPNNGTMGIDEGENQDGDNSFIMRLFTETVGNTHFDDIVLWRTQDQLYAESGRDTCIKP